VVGWRWREAGMRRGADLGSAHVGAHFHIRRGARTRASIVHEIFARVSLTGYTNCADPRDAAENEGSSHGEKGRRHE